MKRYILNNLIAIDQLGNTLLGGYPDETISSRAYRLEANGRTAGKIARPAIDWLFALLGDHDHCFNSYVSEINRRQINLEIRRPGV